MSQHTIGGLFVGVFTILVAGAFAAQAISTRRRRVEIAETYDSAGGPVYTAVQLGCAGVLGLVGLAILVLVLVGGR